MPAAGGTPIHASRLLPGLIRSFARLQAGVFRAQHAIYTESATGATSETQLLAAVRHAQNQTRRQQQQWARRAYVVVGAAYARHGVPKQRTKRAESEPWGPPENQWWSDTYRPTLGAEPWWDAWLAAQLRYVEQTNQRRIAELDAAGQAAVRHQIAAGIAQRESVSAIALRIDNLLGNKWTSVRATTIARTEVPTAARAGTFQSVFAVGVEDLATKSWQDSGDDRTRKEHAEATLENQDVLYGDPFIVASSSTGAPQRLQFPGDTSLGADASTTINCRCDFFVDVHKGKP